MPIVSSTFVLGHAQADGRRYVTERHTFDDGSVETAEYLADDKVDHAAIRDARALVIVEQRTAAAAGEAERNLASAKLRAVLYAAMTARAITKDEIEKAGYEVTGG